LNGNYQAASVGPSPGNISINFTDASDGTLTWPGGRYRLRALPSSPAD
jgi:hypothetical protein